MQATDGEPTETVKKPDEPQATAEGSKNYPWYIMQKEKTAWKPGDEPGWASFLEAFNQGRSFNDKLKGEEQTGKQLDVSTILGTAVLLLVVVWAAQVALSLVDPY